MCVCVCVKEREREVIQILEKKKIIKKLIRGKLSTHSILLKIPQKKKNLIKKLIHEGEIVTHSVLLKIPAKIALKNADEREEELEDLYTFTHAYVYVIRVYSKP